MPRVPRLLSTVTAAPARGRLEAAQIVPEAVAGLGKEGFRVASTYAEYQVARNKAANQVEASERFELVRAKVGEGIRLLRLQPDVRTHRQNAMQLMQEAAQEAIEGSTNDDVKQQLQSHFNSLAGSIFREEGQFENKLLIDRSKAALQVELDSFERDAVEAIHPLDRQHAQQQIEYAIRSRTETGVLSADQAVEEEKRSKKRVLEGNMDFLRRTDRSRLRELDREGAFADADPITRLKILEAARQDEEQEESRQERAFKKAQDAVERHVSALANQGIWSDADSDAALRGHDPFITPDKARQYIEVNQNPPGGGGSLQVRGIMEDYHSGASTFERIQATRELLNRLRRDLGRPNALVDRALNELQTDERTMRSVTASELSAAIKYAEDKFKAESEPLFPGRIGTLQRNEREADLAAIRNRLRRSANPASEADKIVEEYIKRTEKDAEATPQRNKDVLKLR